MIFVFSFIFFVCFIWAKKKIKLNTATIELEQKIEETSKFPVNETICEKKQNNVEEKKNALEEEKHQFITPKLNIQLPPTHIEQWLEKKFLNFMENKKLTRNFFSFHYK
jgi:hypothetical protein